MRHQASEAESNQLSVRLELQADCLSGIWAHEAEKKGILEVGDIDEALNAASQIGDDAIQKRTRGYVVPESFNHGTSEQRSRWFKRGYQQGDVNACDTFGASQV
jgi:predicted metalloprotease